MQSAALEPIGGLSGVVDRFIRPRTLKGWVINRERRCGGKDITITARLSGRLIGEGRPIAERPDVVDERGYLAGFQLECSEDIPDEAVAFGRLNIDASDPLGATGTLPIYDRERNIALATVLRSAPPMGAEAVSTLLGVIAAKATLTGEAKQALVDLRTRHFSEGGATPKPPPARDPAAEADRQLMMRFESLGADCDLGIVQRSFGAEPLGLLRFSSIRTQELTAALADRLRGVGSPVLTVLSVDNEGEYRTSDRRYGMQAHTFFFEGSVERDELFGQQCKKIAYLARNLLETIEDGEKILVHHMMPNRLSEAQLQALLDAVRAIGPSPLLYVENAVADGQSGTVVLRDNGLLVGYLARVEDKAAQTAQANAEVWRSICRAAVERVSSADAARRQS
jgi:hypothetical protein